MMWLLCGFLHGGCLSLKENSMESTEIVEELVTSAIDYSDRIDLIIEYLDSVNGFFFRLCQGFEFFLALVITVVICAVYYSYLKFFTRF